jgi:hypothetical protein
VQSHLPAKKAESTGWQERVRPGLVLCPEWVRRAEPEERRKGVAWVALRVVVRAKWAVEA